MVFLYVGCEGGEVPQRSKGVCVCVCVRVCVRVRVCVCACVRPNVFTSAVPHCFFIHRVRTKMKQLSLPTSAN